MHGIIHPDVFIQCFPPKSQPPKPQADFLQFWLWNVCQQGILGGRETHQALVGELEPDAAAFHPAPQGAGR